MVSNYERILDEITTEARRLASETGIDADPLADLVMRIVDAEDRHRIKRIDVNKVIEDMISTVAMGQLKD